ncbi:unnamed protein product [Cylicocyclus nassatus]|uniref:lysozyme n=1 Tax=Cylicocyclus nassatus TaxID=53992 RepID=A0AA36M8V8_CYLNA|nr:unnamed protein product [Cylicocyclus nassatus]CAJ0601938.1 unnamed protein product [Cylicocyclus nassatus]
MLAIILIAIFLINATTEDCLKCICKRESGCKPIGCHMDVGSLSCGYYQIKLDYYKDCGTPGRKKGESVTKAWKRCANNYNCSTKCVKAYYNRYKGLCPSSQGACQKMARLHNGGPSGCKIKATVGYWKAVKKCCTCK